MLFFDEGSTRYVAPVSLISINIFLFILKIFFLIFCFLMPDSFNILENIFDEPSNIGTSMLFILINRLSIPKADIDASKCSIVFTSPLPFLIFVLLFVE